MAEKSKLQEMRQRLDVNRLDEHAKKDMFQKLQKAGGQVIDLDATAKSEALKSANDGSTRVLNTRKKETPARPKTVPAVNAVKKEEPKQTKKSPPVKKTDPKPKLEQSDIKSKIPSIFSMYLSQINCFFSWIFDFGAQRFRYRYQKLVLQDFQVALSQLSTALIPLYNGDIHALDFRNNLYESNNLLEYELGFRICKLFDMETFKLLQANMSKGVPAAEQHLKHFYKQLQVLKPYSSHCKGALSVLMRCYGAMFPKKGKSFSIAQAEKDLALIWEKFFLETEPLMLYYWRLHCRTQKQEIIFADYLSIEGEVPPVGNMANDIQAFIEAKKMQEKMDDDEDSQENETQEPTLVHFPNDYIGKGIEFILDNVNFLERLDAYKTNRDLRALFTLEDKLFYSYCIVDCFDSEFSFLWSSSAVNFYVIPDSSDGRYDPKKELVILNGRINQFYEQTNEYLRQLRACMELNSSNGNVSRKALQLEGKEKELSRTSFSSRGALITLLEEYRAQLNKVLSSKDHSESCVGNWDELVDISTNAGKKHMSGVTVFEALNMAYSLVCATEWLLSKSDLSGIGTNLIHPEVIPYETYKSSL